MTSNTTPGEFFEMLPPVTCWPVEADADALACAMILFSGCENDCEHCDKSDSDNRQNVSVKSTGRTKAKRHTGLSV
jgi:hypothetical protein